jgi:hypothetical protein
MVSILSATERDKGCSCSISRQRGIILLLFLVPVGTSSRSSGLPLVGRGSRKTKPVANLDDSMLQIPLVRNARPSRGSKRDRLDTLIGVTAPLNIEHQKTRETVRLFGSLAPPSKTDEQELVPTEKRKPAQP